MKYSLEEKKLLKRGILERINKLSELLKNSKTIFIHYPFMKDDILDYRKELKENAKLYSKLFKDTLPFLYKHRKLSRES